MVGSGLIWAPPGRGRRVPGARNGPFWPPKNPGACFWGRKKPLREWPHAIPRFSIKTGLLGRRKTQGRVFGGGKNPCGKHADSHPGFGQGPVSNPARQHHPGDPPGFHQLCLLHAAVSGGTVLAGVRTRCLRGASSVCQPTGQSDDGGPSGQGIPRSDPSFSDTSYHFQTQKPHFLTSFQQRKSKFSDA